MAKVIITLEDKDIENGAVGVNFEFTPELPQEPEEEGDETPVQLTPAQAMAAYIGQAINAATGGAPNEEDSSEAEGQAEECCTQTNEGTCCGGNCTPAPAEG